MKLHASLLSLIAITACSQACAQSNSAPENYFQAFGRVLLEVRAAKWTEELCSEKFPDTKAMNVAAYADWKARNIAFINEMEGQFAVIESHWRKLKPSTADFGSSIRKLSDGIDTNKQKLKAHYQANGDDFFRKICELYPERVASPKIDLENVLSERRFNNSAEK
jgi:hypothetical protein